MARLICARALFRQSLGASDYREALRKEKDLIRDAKAGKLAAKRNEVARLPFRDAAERVLQDRTLRHLQAVTGLR